MTTRSHPEITSTTTPTRPADLAHHQSLVLVAAFALSVTHTVYAQVVGLASPDFTVAMPTTWAFYVLGFTAAALARRPGRGIQRVVVAYLVVMVGISVVVYPATFTPQQQTPFAWFENDLYVALLVLALYLGIQRLRGLVLRPGGTTGADDRRVRVLRPGTGPADMP